MLNPYLHHCKLIDKMNTNMQEIEKIIKAIEKLIKNDSFLLGINVNERTLTHKIAIYLEELYPNYHIDCEYNRNGEIPKKLDNMYNKNTDAYDLNGTTVYPDIIIHKRGTNNNFIIIEAKKSSEKNEDLIDRDRIKLKEYKNQLGYKYAFFVTIPVGEDLKNIDYSNIIEEI